MLPPTLHLKYLITVFRWIFKEFAPLSAIKISSSKIHCSAITNVNNIWQLDFRQITYNVLNFNFYLLEIRFTVKQPFTDR